MLSKVVPFLKDLILAHLPWGTMVLVKSVSQKSNSRHLGVFAGVLYYILFCILMLGLLILIQPFARDLIGEGN